MKYTSDGLEKLVVVIPTYNRKRFLLRSLRYWKGTLAKIIILDGSEKAIPLNEIKSIDPNFHYIHRNTSISERLVTLSNSFIENFTDFEDKFITLQGDDEFFVRAALSANIRTLEEDTDLGSSGNMVLGFRLKTNKKVASVHCYENFFGYARLEQDDVNRAIEHFREYRPSQIYSVMRAANWIACVQSMCVVAPRVYAISELQFEITASYIGKSAILPQLGWLRSIDENPQIITPDTATIEEQQFSDWWLNERNKDECNQFVEALTQNIVFYKKKHLKTNQSDTRQISRDLERICDVYARNTVKRVSITGKVSDLVSKKLLHKYRHARKRLVQSLMASSIDNVLEGYCKKGINTHSKEIKYAFDLIEEFHSN